MEIFTPGKVLVLAKVENLCDLFDLEQGRGTAAEVRTIEIDVLVDTRNLSLSLPRHHIARLGLKCGQPRKARTGSGVIEVVIYEAVQLTVQGRDCRTDVIAVSDDCPAVLGRIVLAMLDFVVDPVHQRLLGNPAHGGEHMIEMY